MTAPQVIEATALQSIQRAEIDSTIATAKNFPRDMKLALKRTEEMVTSTPEIADACHFSIPRKDKSGRRVNIEGPSIRFAEILASQWGNLRIASRVTDIGQKQVCAQGVCLDLETNVAYDVEVRKSIVSKDGRRYSDDVIVANANASAAIAQRNAILKAVPRPLWWPQYEAALQTIGGGKIPMATRWQRAVTWFNARGVDESRLRAAIGIKKPGELTSENLVTLTGWRNSIEQDADALEEIFGEPAAQEDAPPKKKRAPKRKAAKEVKAEAEPEAEPEAAPEEEAAPDGRFADNGPTEEEREQQFSKRWLEWTQMRNELTQDDIRAAREAAGVEMITPAIGLEALEIVVAVASEAMQGARE